MSCNFVWQPKKVQLIGDFRFHFYTKQSDIIEKHELRDLVEDEANRYQKWLGRDPETNLVNRKRLDQGRINVDILEHPPKIPFKYGNYWEEHAKGYTYPLSTSKVWYAKIGEAGVLRYELHHHFTCKVFVEIGKLDKCNHRTYIETEGNKWRRENVPPPK